MTENFDLSDNPATGENSRIKWEAKEVYSRIIIELIENLKLPIKEFNRGEDLVSDDFIKLILISEDDFVKLYISKYKK